MVSKAKLKKSEPRKTKKQNTIKKASKGKNLVMNVVSKAKLKKSEPRKTKKQNTIKKASKRKPSVVKQKPKTKDRKTPRQTNLIKKSNDFEREVKPEKAFYFCDGEIARSLKELIDVLGATDDDVFYYHVNNERNDFYNWIKDVFDETELAEKILNVKDPKDFQIIILKEMLSKK